MSDILAAELAKAKAKLEHEKIHGREKKEKHVKKDEEVTRNRGIEKRMSRDDKYRVTKSSAQKSGYENMQKKAELYKQFHEGKIDQLEGGVMERREEDREDGDGSRDSSDSEYDSSADLSEVEIVDEFGRTRMVPKRKRYLFEARKEVSREGYGSHDTIVKSRDMVEKPANIIYGDVVQTASFVKRDIVIEEDETSTSHYDSTKEIRNRGVGFMQFSQDNEVRERQMGELKEARAVTEAFVEEKKKEKEKGEEEESDLERFRKRYEARERRVKEVYGGEKEGEKEASSVE